MRYDNSDTEQAAPGERSKEQPPTFVRGETVREQNPKSPSKESQPAKDAQQRDPQQKDAAPKSLTVVVRGEAVNDQDAKSQSNDPQSKDGKSSQSKEKEKAPPKQVSAAKVKLQSRLPALEDDGEIGVQKDQVVTRDGKADLAFTGILRASAASPSAPKGKWQECRVYETNGGKHVFSKVTRSIFAEDQDTHEAEVFDPSPASMPSQLLRSARDLTRSHPLTWTDAAVAFFGYDPLAKSLYRKLSGRFEEQID